MSMTEYQLFCAIAEQRNMARAAEILHITPSAATHAMNALERKIGFPLINRSRSGITLTSNGKLLLPRFQAILSGEEILKQEISKINGMERGTVRLGVFDSVCTNWLPMILKSFHSKYPNIDVTVFQSGYSEIESMLLDAALDIGFVSLPSSEYFDTITLLHDRLLCITPLDFKPKNPAYVTPEDLREQPLIISQRGIDKNIQAFLEENHLKTAPQYSIAVDSSAIAMVESGLCCCIMTELILKRHAGNYQTFPLVSNKYRTIGIATLSGKEPVLATQKMIEEIRTFICDI